MPTHAIATTGEQVDPTTGELNGYMTKYKSYVAFLTHTPDNLNWSGNLIVGREYTITSYESGDDFTNVGAAANETGVVFIATGTTPAAYSNGSGLTRSPYLTAIVMNAGDTNFLGDVVWTAPGSYVLGTLPGAFTEGKTFCLISNNLGGSVCFSIAPYISPGSIIVTSEEQSLTDARYYGASYKLNSTPIEIRVYE